MWLEIVTIILNSSSSAVEQRAPNLSGSDVAADDHKWNEVTAISVTDDDDDRDEDNRQRLNVISK